MATTRHLTILLTDIKGFTDKTSHKSRADIDAMLAEHREIVLPALEDRGGRLLKTIGDAFLMTFDSPTNAVLAGVAVQEALRRRNEGRTGEDRLEVRIAINAGEVNITDSDVFGEPVNITARIEGVAEAGEVFFTEAVYLAMNKAEVPSSEVGKFKLKGIEGEIKVYKVRRETPLSGTALAPAGAVGASRVIELGDPAPKASRVPDRASAPAAPPPLPVRGGPSGLGRRAAATLLDVVICGILAGAVAAPFEADEGDIRLQWGKASAPHVPGPKDEPYVVKTVDGEEVRFTKDGVRVRSKQIDVSLKPTGLAVRESLEGDDEVLVEDGAMRVVRKKSRKSLKDKLFPLVWLVLNGVALASWGATPGKKVLGLAVVTSAGTALDTKAAVMRSLLTLLSASPLGLGYLWAFWEKDRRGWHDLLAGTRVVRVEEPAKSA